MKLAIHPSARADLRRLLQIDVNVVSKLLALIREIESDPGLIDRLNIENERIEVGEFDINVMGIVSLQRKNEDIFRLKLWDTEGLLPYRIIHGNLPAGQRRRQAEIIILAVTHRDEYNYEPDHPTTKRIRADFHDERGW